MPLFILSQIEILSYIFALVICVGIAAGIYSTAKDRGDPESDKWPFAIVCFGIASLFFLGSLGPILSAIVGLSLYLFTRPTKP